MSIPFFFIGSLSFLFVLFRSLSDRNGLLFSMVIFAFSVLLITLTKGGGVIAQASSAFNAIAVGIISALVIRGLFSTAKKNIYIARAIFASLLIISILTVHNLYDLGALISAEPNSAVMTANPWGIVILLLIVVAVVNARVSMDDAVIVGPLRQIILVITFLFITVDVLVVFGILEGNTKKLGDGMGGRGLANISTNETGILGVSLLLWNLIFLYREKKISVLHFLAGSGSFAMIIFAKSRVALGLSLMLFGLYFFYSEIKVRTKAAVFLPVLIIIMILAATVIQERSQSDVIDNPSNPLSELPGSGRPVIWFYYLDAFIYTAQSNPTQWVTGVGVVGLLDLYDLTPLEQFSLVLKNAAFFPLHSDMVKVFLISGFAGLIAWIVFPYFLWKIPKNRQYRFQSVGAISVFFIFTTVDMLNYFPFAVMLLILAVASATEPETGGGKEMPS